MITKSIPYLYHIARKTNAIREIFGYLWLVFQSRGGKSLLHSGRITRSRRKKNNFYWQVRTDDCPDWIELFEQRRNCRLLMIFFLLFLQVLSVLCCVGSVLRLLLGLPIVMQNDDLQGQFPCKFNQVSTFLDWWIRT